MIDLHSHILHGVDDGSETIEESIEMVRRAKENGFEKILLTPHFMEGSYEATEGVLIERFTELKEMVAKEAIDVELLLGRELYFETRLESAVVSGEALSLAETPYLLIELPMLGMPMNFKHTLHKLTRAGHQVIIAHPERNAILGSDLNLVRELKESGVYFQMNVGSLVGKYGGRAKTAAEKLLDAGLVHFAAVDAHRASDYGRHLAESLDRLKGRVNESNYELLMRKNQEAVLSGGRVRSMRKVEPVKTTIFERIFRGKEA